MFTSHSTYFYIDAMKKISAWLVLTVFVMSQTLAMPMASAAQGSGTASFGGGTSTEQGSGTSSFGSTSGSQDFSTQSFSGGSSTGTQGSGTASFGDSSSQGSNTASFGSSSASFSTESVTTDSQGSGTTSFTGNQGSGTASFGSGTQGSGSASFGTSSQGSNTVSFGSSTNSQGSGTASFGTTSGSQGSNTASFGSTSGSQGSGTASFGTDSSTQGSGTVSFSSGSQGSGTASFGSQGSGTASFSNGNTNGTQGSGTVSFGDGSHRPTVVLLQAVNMTTTTATLLYNGSDVDSTDILYNVCYGTTSGSHPNCGPSNNEFFNLTGLSASTTYYWTVTPSDSFGEGDIIGATELSFTTPSTDPTNHVPTITASTGTVSQNSATVSWTVTDPDGTAGHTYDVCFATDINNVTSNCQFTTTGTSYTLTNLTKGTQYYWTVRVRDGNYVVYPTNGILGFTTLGTTSTNQPPRVNIVLPSASDIDGTSARLSWTPLNVESGETFTYRACLSTNLNTLVSSCTTQTTQDTAQTFTGLTKSTTYYFNVLVSDDSHPAYESAINGPISFMTGTQSTVNNAPVVVLDSPADQSTQTSTAVTLNWTGTDTDSGDQGNLTYELYIANSTNGTVLSESALIDPANRVTLANNQATSYVYNGSNGETVTWTVRVTDGKVATPIKATNGPRSFIMNTSGSNQAPVFNGVITPTNGTTFNQVQDVNFSWSATDPEGSALTYSVYLYGVARGATAPSLAVVRQAANNVFTGSSTSFMLPAANMTDNRDYYWTITASDGTNIVEPSNVPFMYTVNTGGTANNAPSVVLNSPANNTVYNTVANRTLNATAADADGDSTTVRYYVRAVSTTDNTVYSHADIAQSQYLVGSTTITTSDQMKYWWTADVTDNIVANPVPAANGPFLFTVNTSYVGANNAPTFVSVYPTPGSVRSSTADFTMTWSAADLDNDPLTYDLYVTSVAQGASAPTLATVMASGNQRLNNSTSTSYTLTGIQNNRDYYWVVTVDDGNVSTPVVVNNAPLMFRVDTNASANNAPVVNLVSPTDGQNFTTAATRTLSANASDLDGDATTVRYYVLAVPYTNTTNYTNADIMQSQYLLSGNTISTSDQMRYIWTADVTDGRVASPVAAFNGPFEFTVNSNPQAQNLTWSFVVTNNASSNTDIPNFGIGDNVIMKVNITNNSGQAQVLNFDSTKYVEIRAVNVGSGTEYYNSSTSQSFTQGATTVTVPANSTITLVSYTWNGVAAGNSQRVSGNYVFSATEFATNASASFNSKTVFILGPSDGNNSGGGGGGGSYYGGGGGGGGGISYDTTTPFNLPKAESDTLKIWYGPIKFEPSNGVVNLPLRHVDVNSKFSAQWDKGTIVTLKNGNRFLGTYFPVARYPLSSLKEPYKSSLPGGISLVDPMFTQYGNLGEKFSKPVTIQGRLAEDINTLIPNMDDLAVIAWDMDSQTWRQIGDKSNFDGKNFSIKIAESTILAVVDRNGVNIPGGNVLPNTPDQGPDLCTGVRSDLTPFPDENNHWSAYYVCRLYRLGAVNGFLDGPNQGLYVPEGLVTRAELLTTVMKLYGYDVANVDTDGLFPDVRKDEWFAAYVALAQQLGIVDGYPDGSFRPSRYVNRAEAMKIILNAAKNIGRVSFDIERRAQLMDEDDYAGFLDVPESAWYSQFVSYAKRKNIVGGKSDGLFHADEVLTRGEMAKIVFLTFMVE